MRPSEAFAKASLTCKFWLAAKEKGLLIFADQKTFGMWSTYDESACLRTPFRPVPSNKRDEKNSGMILLAALAMPPPVNTRASRTTPVYARLAAIPFVNPFAKLVGFPFGSVP